MFSQKLIVKTAIWRVIASVITFILVLLGTGSVELGLTIGVVDVILKTLAYYFYEVYWESRKK